MVAILALMLNTEHDTVNDVLVGAAVVLTVASAAQYFWAARGHLLGERRGAVTAGQVVLVVAAYLGGSLPFGYWAGRLHGIDIRQQGSGNTGATNVWRVLGKRAGIPVLVLDIAKGFVPALIGLQIAGAGTAIVAGAAAVVGPHLPDPARLRRRQGRRHQRRCGARGDAGARHRAGAWCSRSCCGCSGMSRWPRWSAAVLYPVTCLLTGEPWPVIVFGAIAALGIVVRHRANIGRLRAGTESQTRSFGRGAPGRGAT